MGKKSFAVWAVVLASCSVDEGVFGDGQQGYPDSGSAHPQPDDPNGPDPRESHPPQEDPRDPNVGSSPSDVCEHISLDSEESQPNVLIVLDRSGSMYIPPDIDRWTPSVEAVRGLVTSYESRFRLGLMLFGTGTSGCGPGELVVPPALNQSSTIMSHLSGDPDSLTGGGTPTANILRQAHELLATLEGTSHVILVTDGAPNCNSQRDDREMCICTSESGAACRNWASCLDDQRTIEAIEALADDGVQTFVIGYETEAWSEVLDQMAQAGNPEATGYIPVDDQQSLEIALEGVAQTVLSCSYRLSSPPGDYRYVRVRIDGEDVDHVSVGGGSGWELRGDRQIEIVGETCERLQARRTASIDIVVECDPILI